VPFHTRRRAALALAATAVALGPLALARAANAGTGLTPCAIGVAPTSYVRLAILRPDGTPSGSVVDSRCPGRTLVVNPDDVAAGSVAVALTGSVAPDSTVTVQEVGVVGDAWNLAGAQDEMQGSITLLAPDMKASVEVDWLAVGGSARHDVIQFVRSL
jgi:hypothetical protein